MGGVHYVAKNGEDCDLLERLSAEEKLGLSEKEMRNILKPELYIGRCPQQVGQYLAKIAPLIEDTEEGSAEIML